MFDSSAAAKERARQKGSPPPPALEKWPMRVLEILVNTDESFATVTLKDVVAILDDFDALGLAMAKLQAKTICGEYRIDAITLYHLGDSLLNWNDVRYRDLATTLLICAMDHCDPPAAARGAARRLLADAMLTSRHKGPGVATARKIVKDGALKGGLLDIYFEGKVLEYEGKSLEALHLYQTWSDQQTELRKRLPHFRNNEWTPEYGDVCKSLARLRAKLGDRTGAEEAIRDAALMYDDPAAYYHLAIEFTKPGSKDFETYLLKAASSDQPKASHELGLFYLNQSRQGFSLQKPQLTQTATNKDSVRETALPSASARGQYLSQEAMLDKHADAREWFTIGAESGITASQVYVALLLREAGRAEEGLEWLQRATKSTDADDWAEAVGYFKRIWRLSTPNPMLMDIESLRKSSRDLKRKNTSILANLDDATWITDRFRGMKKMDGRWVSDNREMRKWKERIAASWR
ncbi:MAG: hypothetical protein Q9166_005757 [cf. Caloplaca sp. 2 TL-2023]